MSSTCPSCGHRTTPRVVRRGDDIPSISDYAHWNEEAAAVWYAENRYDMENWDEVVEDPFDEPDWEDEEDEDK